VQGLAWLFREPGFVIFDHAAAALFVMAPFSTTQSLTIPGRRIQFHFRRVFVLTNPDKFGHWECREDTMGKVYQSVRGIMHGTLNRKNNDVPVSVQTNENSGLDDAIETLEQVVVNGLARLKTSVTDNQAAAASKVHQAEQVSEDLRATVAGLEAQLRETEENLRRREAAGQKMEESLGAEIRDLQSALKQKEEALESRNFEINDLRSKTDVLTKQASDLELAVEQAKGAAAGEARRAEQVIEGLKTNISALEDKLGETEDNVQKKDETSRRMEESLGAEIRGLQNALRQKEEALNSRDFEVKDLKSENDVLSKQVSELRLEIEQARGAAESEARRAEQTIEGFKANIAGLEAKLRESEDNVQRKDETSRKMEESFGAEIHDLQSVLKQKEEALESRDSEVNDLRSKTEVLTRQVSHLTLVVDQAKGALASEVHRAEQVIEGLRVKITALEAKLREAQENVQKNHLAGQKMEESLRAEIRDLQSVVKQKEEALESRDFEINDLKSKTDVLTKEVLHLESAVEQAKAAAASEVYRAEQIIEGLKAEIAMFHARVRQKEQIVGQAGSVNKDVDRKQDKPVVELNAGLETSNGMEEMHSFLGRAETAPGFQAKDFGTAVSGEQVKTDDEKAAASRFQPAAVTPIITDAVPETVSGDVFDRMIAEFSERTNVIKSIASLIMRHHVRALGQSMEEFPRTRLPDLLKSLSEEISDDKMKASFLQRFGKA
jgi:chromosome segregation ATPase